MIKEDFLYVSVTVIIAVVIAVSGAFSIYMRMNQIPLPTTLPKGECKSDSDCPSGYLCIQSCGPPVVREGDPTPPYYCETKEVASQPRICPICLASNTEISTPSGTVNVKDIKTGMLVWSSDKNGNKIESTIVRVSRTMVLTTHQVIHLVLSDKREVWLSPGHPTIDGTAVSELRAGDIYDGSHVLLAEVVPYWDNATYDLLPDSYTGYYLANGILFGSTLK